MTSYRFDLFRKKWTFILWYRKFLKGLVNLSLEFLAINLKVNLSMFLLLRYLSIRRESGEESIENLLVFLKPNSENWSRLAVVLFKVKVLCKRKRNVLYKGPIRQVFLFQFKSKILSRYLALVFFSFSFWKREKIDKRLFK